MESAEIPDSDLEYIESIRKRLRSSRFWAWMWLLIAFAYLALIVGILAFLQMLAQVVRSHDFLSSWDFAVGILLGFPFGLMIGLFAVSMGHSIVRVLEGLKGNKQQRMLVKYFDMATGEGRGSMSTKPDGLRH